MLDAASFFLLLLMLARSSFWVAVKERKLSYHTGFMLQINNRVSPIY